MEQTFFSLLTINPYMTYSIAVLCVTAMIRNAVYGNYRLGPKWITLVVGVLLGAFMFIFRWINLETPTEFYTLFAALGASSAFYDYVIKPILDKVKGKNPFKE
jgi:hypothetical protein